MPNNKEINELGVEVAKRGRPKGVVDTQPRKPRSDLAVRADASDMSRYIRQARNIVRLPTIDISDVNQVEDRLEWYFDQCEKEGLKPTMMGMCNALGVSRQTMYNWGRGEYRSGTHLNLIQKYHNMLEEIWEMEMVDGKINPIVGIFLGKNNFGYADKQEFELSPKDPLGEQRDTREIENRYLDSIVDDSDDDYINSVVDD